MRKFLITAGIVFSFAACSKSKYDDAISGMEKYKDKMCECKDKACTDKVREEMRDWQKSMRDKFKDEDEKNVPKDFIEKVGKIEHDMKECRRKFDSVPTPEAPPTTPPAAPAP